jgi:hypothetical protein
MPAPISLDLPLRIVRAVERGSSIRGQAQRLPRTWRNSGAGALGQADQDFAAPA